MKYERKSKTSNKNIPNAIKLSNTEAKDSIYKDENTIIENKEEKNSVTWKIIIFCNMFRNLLGYFNVTITNRIIILTN